MSRPVLIVTCSEPDASPFLAQLPTTALAETALISTRSVISAARRETPVGQTLVLGGPSTFADARRLLSDGSTITVVVAPDPWGPFKGKGFVRMRLALPFVLPDVTCCIVELERGEAAGRVREGVPRAELVRWLLSRELQEVGRYLIRECVGGVHVDASPAMVGYSAVRLAAGIPLAGVTLIRSLTYVWRTESRARRKDDCE